MNKREAKDLLAAWLVISFAFAAVFFRSSGVLSLGFLSLLAISLIAVGTGFLFHELGHRAVAIKFGAHAEFVKWNMGLVIAFFLGVVALATGSGFIFAAPGAVYIYKEYLSLKENGIISVIGPLINIAVGLGFLLGFVFAGSIGLSNSFWGLLFGVGASINLFLAMFNLLPFPPLDGSKVMQWNPLLWGALFLPLALTWLLGVW